MAVRTAIRLTCPGVSQSFGVGRVSPWLSKRIRQIHRWPLVDPLKDSDNIQTFGNDRKSPDDPRSCRRIWFGCKAPDRGRAQKRVFAIDALALVSAPTIQGAHPYHYVDGCSSAIRVRPLVESSPHARGQTALIHDLSATPASAFPMLVQGQEMWPAWPWQTGVAKSIQSDAR